MEKTRTGLGRAIDVDIVTKNKFEFVEKFVDTFSKIS